MNLRTLLAAGLLATVLASTTILAQNSSDSDEGARLGGNVSSGGYYTFSWWGRAGHTYFLQQSDDLAHWTYLPLIEPGAGRVIQWGFTSNQDRSFLRLMDTDAFTRNAYEDDFDGDGVGNYDELAQGSDPLLATLDAASGLPLDWERFYHVAPGTDADTPAPRGDGLTYRRAFAQGLNPNDAQHESLPALAFVRGGDQRGAPGTVLPVPLGVRVYSHRKYTAPVTFTVSAGTALLSLSGSGDSPVRTLTLVPLTPSVDADGTPCSIAQVYVYLPAASVRDSTITVTAASGPWTRAESTRATAIDPGVRPPGAPAIGKVTATTVDLSWTPYDPSLSTYVEVAHGYGVWSVAASFAPGETRGTLSHLKPDQPLRIRLYSGSPPDEGAASNHATAGGAGNVAGTGSDPSGEMAVTPLSVPVVEGIRSINNASNFAFPGRQTFTNRYLRVDVKSYAPDFNIPGITPDAWDYKYTDEFSLGKYDAWWRAGAPIHGPVVYDYDNSGPPVDGALVVESDTVAYDCGVVIVGFNEPFHAVSRYTFSEPYNSLAQFVRDVESKPSAYLPQFGGDTAAISLTEDVAMSSGSSYPDSDILCAYSDHHYAFNKLRYQFQCNADPAGQVVYDVVFTPDDGGEVVHEVHVIPTHGKTLVPEEPLILDPTQATNPALLDAGLASGKKNGTYRVVPIALQPDDWKDEPEGGGGNAWTGAAAGTDATEPDDPGQTGVKGAMVASILPTGGRKHFVSPKKAGNFVVLRAQLPEGVDFDSNFGWVQAPAGTPQFEFSGNKIKVPRDVADKYPVVLKARNKDGTLGVDVDTMDVWIVWATITTTEDIPITAVDDGEYLTIRGGYRFAHTIAPASICAPNADIPNLTGKNDSAPPGSKNTCDEPLAGGVDSHWDGSRRIREKYFAPAGYLVDCRDKAASSYFPNTVVGNDDVVTSDETNNPYADNATLTSEDSPKGLKQHTLGDDGDTVERRLQFEEFTRLELGRVWYRISDLYPWRIHEKFKHVAGKWTNDHTVKATDNADF